MADINALKAKIVESNALQVSYIADVNALILKLQASSAAPDFSDEIAAIQTGEDAVTAGKASVDALLNPPAAPSS